jgi:hypothetical protein
LISRPSLFAQDDSGIRVPFTFRRRPSPVPTDLRPIWRICLALLVLEKSCRGGTASLPQLHLLNWAVRNEDSRERFRAIRAHKLSPRDMVVRFDPTLNRAMEYAAAEGLVERMTEARVRITDKGRKLAREIDRTAECLVAERAFLEEIGKSVTDKFVRELLVQGARR